MLFYKFLKELDEGIVLSRPNRFIMEILVNGKKELAHCPVTGKIGRFDFKKTPCLFSRSNNPERKTKFTIEAISPQGPETKRKSWIGINQGKSNHFLEFFFKNSFFPKMIKNPEKIEREKKLGNSRIDFKIDNNFIEIKTLVNNIPYGSKNIENSPVMSADRLIKHFKELEKYSKNKNGKAIVLLCNQYNAKPFQPPENSQKTKIGKVVKNASDNGVENWQVNLKIDKKGVYFLDYFKLDLF